MKRTLSGSLTVSIVLACAFLGCNSVLGNTRGTLVETEGAGTLPDPDVDPDPGPGPAPAAGPEGGTTVPSPGCPAGLQMCKGTCVSLTDPRYGCGDPSCTACPSAYSRMACDGRQCVIATCEPGHADCNGTPADGCEKDLSLATSCGACNTACAAPAPFCAPMGPAFQCTNGCPASAPLSCGAECVDPLTTTNHCGGCDVACPAVANGTAACVGGVCTFTCAPDARACAGMCSLKTDPTACGEACIACPIPAGATATCVNDACGMTCMAGQADCDANAVNGCEAALMNDPLNCGACGVSCAGQPCVGGVCQPPPPPPVP